jgi:phosphoenolpyruvate carboxylase
VCRSNNELLDRFKLPLTDEIRRAQPTPQDEMRYFHETVWKGVPKFLRRVDTALKNIGINERVPYDAPLIKFSHKRDVCLLARMMSANLYVSEIEDLLF